MLRKTEALASSGHLLGKSPQSQKALTWPCMAQRHRKEKQNGVPMGSEREDKARGPGKKAAYCKQVERPEIATGVAVWTTPETGK